MRCWVIGVAISVLVGFAAASLRAQGGWQSGRGAGNTSHSTGRSAASYAGPGGMGLALFELPAVSYEGNLKEITDQLVILVLDDGRTFNFKRSTNTKFFKNSKALKAAELKPGDRVALVAKLDDRAFLVASTVTFVEMTAERSAEIAAGVRRAQETADAASPVRGWDGPQLKRRALDEPGPIPDPRAGQSPSDDPLIAKAQDAALSFSEALPNFLCEERMQRFSRDSRMIGWKPLDTISAEVIYEDGRESYRNLKINDRPTVQKMEQLSGSWSTGEFNTTLRNLFHPASAAVFQSAEYSRLLDLPARVYDFEVRQENSHWNIQSDFQKITPGYTGSVWIEPASGRVLRMEMQAVDLPPEFPMDQVETAVDYAFLPIGAAAVLLPVHAENLGCQRGTDYCNRNVIDFRNYRKYVSDSTVKFDP